MNDIRRLMRPFYRTVEGGLFSEVTKADVGGGAAELQGRGVALMSWADPFMPDPSIPEPVLKRAIELLQGGFPSHYTMPIGSPALKEALAARIERKCGLKLDPYRNMMINPGSDIGLMLAMSPWIEPGDEVLVHDPSYASNFMNAELLGGRTVRVPTFAEDGWHLRIEEYEKRLTPKTKMVLLNDPNNPTGASYTREELGELAEFIIKNDLICVSDQAFEDCLYPGTEMVNIAQLPGMWERTVTVCSCSKGLGLSGFRVGWMYADDRIMDVYHGIAVNMQGATGTLAQEAIIPAVEDDSYVAGYIEKYDRRRKYAYEAFNSCPGVRMGMPEAGFYAWVDVSALGSSAEITARCASEALVSLNDGSFYGSQGEGYLRLILACFWEDADCFAAVDRLAALFRKIAEEKGIA